MPPLPLLSPVKPLLWTDALKYAGDISSFSAGAVPPRAGSPDSPDSFDGKRQTSDEIEEKTWTDSLLLRI